MRSRILGRVQAFLEGQFVVVHFREESHCLILPTLSHLALPNYSSLAIIRGHL